MITMLVIGGEGTLVGPLVGCALLTLLPEIFQPFALYKRLAEGALLVLAFQYLPAGIYGSLAVGLSRFLVRPTQGSLVSVLQKGETG
jgi:branched-chain amino acid transport system permease protein